MCHKSATSWQAVLESLQIAAGRTKQNSYTYCLKSSTSNNKRETYKTAHWPTNCYDLRILTPVSLSPWSKIIYIDSEPVNTCLPLQKSKTISINTMKRTVLIITATNIELLGSTSFLSLFQSLLPMPSMSPVSDRWTSLGRIWSVVQTAPQQATAIIHFYAHSPQ